MDFRLVTRFCRGPSDFVEGVRALLINKCGQPRWDPPSIDQARAAARPGGGARPVGQAACAPSLSVILYLDACGACITYWIVVRKGNLSASASSPPGLCSSSAFWPASLSGAGRLVACTLRHSPLRSAARLRRWTRSAWRSSSSRCRRTRSCSCTNRIYCSSTRASCEPLLHGGESTSHLHAGRCSPCSAFR